MPISPDDAKTGSVSAESGPDATRALTRLHSRTVDALSGFETMVDKAEPSFRPVAERFRDLHARHSQDLSDILRDRGEDPTDDATVMSTVNRAVVSLRSLLDGIDEDALDAVVRGETHVLDAFDDAIDAEDDLKDRLRSMRDELVQLIVDVRG